MSQNRSHAVMAQRAEPHDSLDFFPTPHWATRALCRHVIDGHFPAGHHYAAWEPACGTGSMALPLAEYFGTVHASDVHHYGFGDGVHDFLGMVPAPVRADWIITNPPFRLGVQFARRAVELAGFGVALLVRTAFLESVDRHRFFTEFPPAVVAQFVERVPMVKGRLSRTASTATSYAWIVWARGNTDTRLRWIPPCRKALERASDWPADEVAA
ncbi:SAM-dependent DNA methyltransferase [Azospirillum palustre]